MISASSSIKAAFNTLSANGFELRVRHTLQRAAPGQPGRHAAPADGTGPASGPRHADGSAEVARRSTVGTIRIGTTETDLASLLYELFRGTCPLWVIARERIGRDLKFVLQGDYKPVVSEGTRVLTPS